MPKSAAECGLGFSEYKSLAKNVNRVKSLTNSQVKDLAKKSLEELSEEAWIKVHSLIKDIPYFPEFFNLAEIPYEAGCCDVDGKNVVLLGILDYFLRNKSILNPCLYKEILDSHNLKKS